MKTNIFDRAKTALCILAGTITPNDGIGLKGYWDLKITRADGSVEEYTRENIVTATGMNRIADLALAANVVSAFNYIVVGTNTGAPADTDTQAQMGEVTNGRKAASLKVQSREWISLTCTYAGNTDALTGIALDSAAISDYSLSSASTGLIANRVNGMAVTLQASDFLNLTVRIRVGSHNQAHST